MSNKPLDISAAKALCDAATAGPWRVCGASDGKCPCGLIWAGHGHDTVARSYSADGDSHGRHEDAAFIAAARTLVPQLIAEVERLSGEQRLNGEIIAKVNDAINRAGIHCALYYWEAIDQIAAERNEARAALASVLSAKDEACRIANSLARVLALDVKKPETVARINHLATIGHSSGEE